MGIMLCVTSVTLAITKIGILLAHSLQYSSLSLPFNLALSLNNQPIEGLFTWERAFFLAYIHVLFLIFLCVCLLTSLTFCGLFHIFLFLSSGHYLPLVLVFLLPNIILVSQALKKHHSIIFSFLELRVISSFF